MILNVSYILINNICKHFYKLTDSSVLEFNTNSRGVSAFIGE